MEEDPPVDGEQQDAQSEEPPFMDPPKGSVNYYLETVFDDLYPENSVNAARQALASADHAAPVKKTAPAEGEEGGDGEAAPPDAEAPGSPSKAMQGMSAEERRAFEDVDVTQEDEVIKKTRVALSNQEKRLKKLEGYLEDRTQEAAENDRQIADYLLTQGLTVKHQFPVGETMLKLESETLNSESLIDPHSAVLPIEKEQGISTGQILKHPNYLAVSKPDEPNYFKNTASLAIRREVRGINKVYSEEQRKLLYEKIRDKPEKVMPKILLSDERAENTRILKRMAIKTDFLKNPRYQNVVLPHQSSRSSGHGHDSHGHGGGKNKHDQTINTSSVQTNTTHQTGGSASGAAGGAMIGLASFPVNDKGQKCPFRITPGEVLFQNYEVGSVYEIKVEFLNIEKIGRRLRIMPMRTTQFSMNEIQYQNQNVGLDAAIAPGMKAFLSVWFSPADLNDIAETLTVITEHGQFKVTVRAQRFQPNLVLEENPIHCGYTLGGSMLKKTLRATNVGGEAAFRFIAPKKLAGVSQESTYEDTGGMGGGHSQASTRDGGGGQIVQKNPTQLLGKGQKTTAGIPGSGGLAELYYYDTGNLDSIVFVAGPFNLSPASFYLEQNESIEISVVFVDNIALPVGLQTINFEIEADNFTSIPGRMQAVVDTLRLEMRAFERPLAGQEDILRGQATLANKNKGGANSKAGANVTNVVSKSSTSAKNSESFSRTVTGDARGGPNASCTTQSSQEVGYKVSKAASTPGSGSPSKVGRVMTGTKSQYAGSEYGDDKMSVRSKQSGIGGNTQTATGTVGTGTGGGSSTGGSLIDPQYVELRAPKSQMVNWSLLPWQMRWDLQIGAATCPDRSILISNGSYLPMQLQWVFVRPPLHIIKELSVGTRTSLDPDLFDQMRSWPEIPPEESPFTIQPLEFHIQSFQDEWVSFCYTPNQVKNSLTWEEETKLNATGGYDPVEITETELIDGKLKGIIPVGKQAKKLQNPYDKSHQFVSKDILSSSSQVYGRYGKLMRDSADVEYNSVAHDYKSAMQKLLQKYTGKKTLHQSVKENTLEQNLPSSASHMVFAYLACVEERCDRAVLPMDQQIAVRGEMQPEQYTQGLPLAANKWHERQSWTNGHTNTPDINTFGSPNYPSNTVINSSVPTIGLQNPSHFQSDTIDKSKDEYGNMSVASAKALREKASGSVGVSSVPAEKTVPTDGTIDKYDYSIHAPVEPLKTSVCIMYAVNLIGRELKPEVRLQPEVATFGVDLLPFVVHRKVVKLKNLQKLNLGHGPATYKVRTTKILRKMTRVKTDFYDPLWIISENDENLWQKYKTDRDALVEQLFGEEMVLSPDDQQQHDNQQQQQVSAVVTGNPNEPSDLPQDMGEQEKAQVAAIQKQKKALKAFAKAQKDEEHAQWLKNNFHLNGSPSWLALEKPYIDPALSQQDKLETYVEWYNRQWPPLPPLVKSKRKKKRSLDAGDKDEVKIPDHNLAFKGHHQDYGEKKVPAIGNPEEYVQQITATGLKRDPGRSDPSRSESQNQSVNGQNQSMENESMESLNNGSQSLLDPADAAGMGGIGETGGLTAYHYQNGQQTNLAAGGPGAGTQGDYKFGPPIMAHPKSRDPGRVIKGDNFEIHNASLDHNLEIDELGKKVQELDAEKSLTEDERYAYMQEKSQEFLDLIPEDQRKPEWKKNNGTLAEIAGLQSANLMQGDNGIDAELVKISTNYNEDPSVLKEDEEGAGALATLLVRPSEGEIPVESEIELELFLRASRECDIDAIVEVEICNCVVLKLRVMAPVRAPKPVIRKHSLIDYGIVHAHSLSMLEMEISNPTDLPTVVKLKHMSKDDIRNNRTGLSGSLIHATKDPAKKFTDKIRVGNERETTIEVVADAAGGEIVQCETVATTMGKAGGPGVGAVIQGVNQKDELHTYPSLSPEEFEEYASDFYHTWSDYWDIVLSFQAQVREKFFETKMSEKDLEYLYQNDELEAMSRHEEYLMENLGGEVGKAEVKQAILNSIRSSNARSSCIDQSLRYLDKFRGIKGDPHLLFFPEYLMLPPRTSRSVLSIFRAGYEESFNELVKLLVFDAQSTNSIYMQILAQVQLPRVTVSHTHMFFPISFVDRVTDERFIIKITNPSGLQAPFRWKLPQDDPVTGEPPILRVVITPIRVAAVPPKIPSSSGASSVADTATIGGTASILGSLQSGTNSAATTKYQQPFLDRATTPGTNGVPQSAGQMPGISPLQSQLTVLDKLPQYIVDDYYDRKLNEGMLPPESYAEFEIRVIPTQKLQAKESIEARVDMYCEVKNMVIPLQVTVRAIVYGLEVDYLAIPKEEIVGKLLNDDTDDWEPPVLTHRRKPRVTLTDNEYVDCISFPVDSTMQDEVGDIIDTRKDEILANRNRVAKMDSTGGGSMDTMRRTRSTLAKSRSTRGSRSFARGGTMRSTLAGGRSTTMTGGGAAIGAALERMKSCAGTEFAELETGNEHFIDPNDPLTQPQPRLNFGRLELKQKKTIRLVLYNRSGLPADWSAHMGKYKAWKAKGKKKAAGSVDDTITTTSSMTGGQQSQSISGFSASPKPRKQKWILHDKHEAQAFSSAGGLAYANEKILKEMGSVALNYGLGYAVSIEPESGHLEPFGNVVIECSCYSDLPGPMKDFLFLNVGYLPEFKIPVEVVSFGNPLYLPPLQVALTLNDDKPDLYPELSFGTLVLADRRTVRKFRLGNASSARIRVEWKIFSQNDIENLFDAGRALSDMRLCDQQIPNAPPDCTYVMVGKEPRITLAQQKMCPFKIEPRIFDLQPHSVADFSVSLVTDFIDKYHYKLVGQGRYVTDEKKSAGGKKPGTTSEPNSQANSQVNSVAGSAVASREVSKSAAASGASASVAGGDSKAVGGRSATPSKILLELEDIPEEPIVPMKPELAMVNNLPKLYIDPEGLNESDSDYEDAVDMKREATTTVAAGAVAVVPTTPQGGKPETPISATRGKRASMFFEQNLDYVEADNGNMDDEIIDLELPESEVLNVVATVGIECIGECIVPRLHIDKKINPSFEKSVVKFLYQSINPIPNLWTSNRIGPIAVGGGHLDPAPGIALGIIRQFTFSNEQPTLVHCRFRIPLGENRFRILKMEQTGRRPVFGSFLLKDHQARHRNQEATGSQGATQTHTESSGSTNRSRGPFEPDPNRFLIDIKFREVVQLLIEFVPPKTWNGAVHDFQGELHVEYPSTEDHMEYHPPQIIKLDAQCRKPDLRFSITPLYDPEPPIPVASYAPPWGPAQLPCVEFQYVHVDALQKVKREFVLFNKTNVVAKWKLFHVAAKGREKGLVDSVAPTIREREEQSLDDPTAFKFDIVEGTLCGPSQKRRLLPLGPCLPKAWDHSDTEFYEPQAVEVTFLPKYNRLYKSKFRLQIEGGDPLDFICMGCGSYDEEDDVMELVEA